MPVQPIPAMQAMLVVPGGNLEERLENLYKMHEDGLINEDVYQAERKRLVGETTSS